MICSMANHTYSILNLNDDRLISIKGNNEIAGILGKQIDDMMIKKHLRKCKLIGEPILGERLDNGTWTGNLGLIQKGEAILYLKSEAQLIDTSIESWMYYLFPFHREKLVILQDISDDIAKASKKGNSANVLNCFNLELSFLFLFIFTILISFSIIIALKLLSNQGGSRTRISISRRIKNILLKYLNGHWNLDYSKLTNITIFILFYTLFLWFIQLVIANNIRTDKVIVDQSILIKDENDALATKKTFCLMEGETELSIAMSYNFNILAKLYNQKNIVSKKIKGTNIEMGERCIVKKHFEMIHMNFDGMFTVIPENMVYLVMPLIGDARSNLIIWFNSKPIIELDYQLISKNRKDLIDLFNKRTLIYAQNGFQKRFFYSLRSMSHNFFKSHTIYRTIEQFVEGNSKFTDLNIDSFKLLFIIYISFCLIILIICLAMKLSILHSIKIEINLKKSRILRSVRNFHRY